MRNTMRHVAVCFGWIAALAFSAGLPALADSYDIGRTTPVKASLADVAELGDWSFGLSLLDQRRELLGPNDEISRLKARSLTANCGYTPTDWLQVRGAVGEVDPDFAGLDGEYGLTWMAGVRAGLLDFVLDESPVVGRKQIARLQAELLYRRSSSHVDSDELVCQEFIVSPYVVYEVQSRAATDWHPYRPQGAAIRVGLLYSSLKADLEGTDYEENRNFGFVLGANIQLGSDVVVDGSVYAMESQDRSFELGLGYNF